MSNSKKKKNTVPMLVKKIKAINLSNCVDPKQIKCLMRTTQNEWMKMRQINRKCITDNLKANKRLLAKYEAEEEVRPPYNSPRNNKSFLVNYVPGDFSHEKEAI